MKKTYETLDLIEKHRVLLWSTIRERLLHHLSSIESKLEPYDIDSIKNSNADNSSVGHSLKELDGFFEKMNES